MEVEVRDHSEFGLRGKVWYRKYTPNYLHREDGPAVIYNDGSVYWYYYNRRYYIPEKMPLNLFLAYCRWEYRKNGK